MEVRLFVLIGAIFRHPIWLCISFGMRFVLVFWLQDYNKNDTEEAGPFE